MSDPTAFDQLKQSVIRYVKTGVNWRIKNTDIASDQKVIDAADISGHATSVTQVSLSTEAVGASTNLAREDHAHKLAQAAAQSFLANPTGSAANLQAVAVAADRIVGRDSSGNLGGILVKVAHLASIAANSVLANISGSPAQPTEVVLSQNSVIGRQTGGAGPVKVSPDMMAPLFREYTATLASSPTGTAVTITAGETVGTWAATTNTNTRQVVPEAGLYEIEFFAEGTTVATTLFGWWLDLGINGTTSGVRLALAYKEAVGAAGQAPLTGKCRYRITTPATQAISAITASGGSNTSINSSGRLTIRKIAP